MATAEVRNPTIDKMTIVTRNKDVAGCLVTATYEVVLSTGVTTYAKKEIDAWDVFSDEEKKLFQELVNVCLKQV